MANASDTSASWDENDLDKPQPQLTSTAFTNDRKTFVSFCSDISDVQDSKSSSTQTLFLEMFCLYLRSLLLVGQFYHRVVS